MWHFLSKKREILQEISEMILTCSKLQVVKSAMQMKLQTNL